MLGSRSAARAEAALGSIRSRVPGARVRAVPLDLADPSSLGPSVDALGVDRLDAVVHNAGVALDDPPRQETRDGHELMFGTNHLGHFALTHWLMPLLSAAPAARVVTVGSFAAKTERLDLADLQSRHDYRPKRTYGRSKLAQMYFGLELDRRLRALGSTVTSVVAHPGGALDSLTPSRPPVHVRTTAARLRSAPAALFVQGKHAGAWPVVRAVLDPRGARGAGVGTTFLRPARSAASRDGVASPGRPVRRGGAVGGQLRVDRRGPGRRARMTFRARPCPAGCDVLACAAGNEQSPDR